MGIIYLEGYHSSCLSDHWEHVVAEYWCTERYTCYENWVYNCSVEIRAITDIYRMSVGVSFVSEGQITLPCTVIIGHLMMTLIFSRELHNGIQNVSETGFVSVFSWGERHTLCWDIITNILTINSSINESIQNEIIHISKTVIEQNYFQFQEKYYKESD
jgi:hypothetical protein